MLVEATADRLLQDVHASLAEQRQLMNRSIALQEEAATLLNAQGEFWTGELRHLRELIVSRPTSPLKPMASSVQVPPLPPLSLEPLWNRNATPSMASLRSPQSASPRSALGADQPAERVGAGLAEIPPPAPFILPKEDLERDQSPIQAGRAVSPAPVQSEQSATAAPPRRLSIMGQAAAAVTGATSATRKSAAGDKVQAPDMEAGALDLRRKLRTGGTQSDIGLKRYMEKHPIRGSCRYLLLNPLFDIFFGLVVVCSVILIGVEIEYTAQRRDFGRRFVYLQSVCCFLFIVEVLIRLTAYGWLFCVGKDYKWNVFDVVCSVTMVVDIVYEVTHPSIQDRRETGVQDASSKTGVTRIVRIARLLRIVRALRIMRATRASREFRKMSYALQYSALTLFWALLLLFFVMYFFATAFTQATTEMINDSGIEDFELLREHVDLGLLYHFYGTLPRSFYSLFLAVSSGRDWYELVAPLGIVHWLWQALFVGFVAMTTFGVMNVVTSVFVESALQSTQHYKDLLIQENMKAKKMYLDHLLEVFKEIDEDDSGAITLDELDQFLQDPKLRLYLESMDIQPDDAKTLFSLLDRDDSGSVSIEEFCQGCLRLKGDAKSFDIHCIIFEHQRLTHKWRELVVYLEAHTNAMDSRLNGLFGKLNGIFGTSVTSAVEKAFDARLGALLMPGGMFTPSGLSEVLKDVLVAPTSALASPRAAAPPPPRTETPKWFLT